jgi:HAD superfamily hydrolase (TIGR01490 family)
MRAAAIFDLDGTLLVGTTAEWLLVRTLLQQRQFGVQSVVGWLEGLCAGLPQGWIAATKANKRYLAGQESSAVLAVARTCFVQDLVPRISHTGIATIAWHKRQGHLTGLLSGAPDFLVELFRNHLGLDFSYGTPLEIDKEYFTGKLTGLHPYAERKVAVLEALFQQYQIDPLCSYGYGNHYTDRFFLHLFGHPTAVNPDKRLHRYAQIHGWPITCFA